jgi:hypothetical protein
MQLTASGLVDQRGDAVAENPTLRTERSRTSTAVLLWIGMGVIHVLSLCIWLLVLRHGYGGRR